MNFLKRAGAILMVVAIFASSCNKYADDFKQLNTKLDAVASSVAGLTQLATDVAATKASVTALQTSVAGLPTTASVTALSTSLTAVSGKVDAIATTLSAVAATGTANATAIAGVKTDLAALVASQAAANAAATASFAADFAKMTALDTKVSAVVASLTAIAAQETALGTAVTAIAAQETALGTAVAANNTAIAANAAALTALAAQAAALATSVANLTTADAAGFAAAVTANAALATQAATILADLTVAKTDASATKLVVDALTVSLAAAKASIDQILANTAPIPVQFSALTANGTTASVSSTILTLTFDVDPVYLTAANITVTGATKGALAGTGLTRSLAISAITVANLETVTVAVSNPSGYVITNDGTAAASRTVAVKVAPPVVFTGVTADGVSGVLTSTVLTLSFDVDPTSLTAANLTVTGATIGALTGTGLTRSLAISAVTVANGANVTVAIASQPAGFNITPASKTVAVNVANTAVAFASITPNGTTGAVTTTSLTLTFSGGTLGTTFTASNITVTGATKGALTGTGNSRVLAISGITVADAAQITVAVTSPAGFVITPAAMNTPVYIGATPLVLSDITANGTSLLVTTSALTLTFSADPTTLAASNITVTGATKGTLTGTGLTRTLAISAITVLDQATVTVAISNPAGYTIAPSSKTVKVNVVPTGVAFTTLAANGTQLATETTSLTLTFSVDPTSLVANDITLTGATKGGLTGSGTTRSLAVTAVTSTSLGVTIVDPVGFAISPSSKTVVSNQAIVAGIAGVTAPVKAATAVVVSTAGTGINAGTVSWSPALVSGVFAASTVYTATVTVTPATNFVFTYIPANYWSVSGGTATSGPASGVVTVVFSATGA